MNNKGILKTLSRGLDILEFLASHPEGQTNKDVASSFNMDPASSFRFLQTLVHCKFVFKEDSKYYLSYHLLELTEATQNALIHVARPLIYALAEETSFTAGLAVIKNLAAIPLILATGKAPLHVNSNLGKPVPLHASALGKALLAYLHDAEREQMLRVLPLDALTPNTIVNRERLRQELIGIRSRGYAVDNQEYLPGVRCVAMPVLNSYERAVASVSVSFPASQAQTSEEFVLQLVTKVAATSEKLTQYTKGVHNAETTSNEL